MHDPFTGYVRVKVVCLFTHRGRLLAIDSFDPTKQQHFWVPIGGRVEFGETSSQAIVREVREELSAEIADLKRLGVLENLFTFDGGEGHEIVFVYDARFVDGAMYEADLVSGLEGEEPFTAHWIGPLVPAHDRPLYPDGLADLISDGGA
ncbi:MAG: NUDIX hydrolase [Actinobacteria bacterium]|nr:NUDIX hydrolase [Actinomycetota bacterium]